MYRCNSNMSAPHSCTFVRCCPSCRPMGMVPTKVRINITVLLHVSNIIVVTIISLSFHYVQIAGLFFSNTSCCGCILSHTSGRQHLPTPATRGRSFYFPATKTPGTSPSFGLHTSSAHGLHSSCICTCRNLRRHPSPIECRWYNTKPWRFLPRMLWSWCCSLWYVRWQWKMACFKP